MISFAKTDPAWTAFDAVITLSTAVMVLMNQIAVRVL